MLHLYALFLFCRTNSFAIMENIRLTTVQSQLHWENISANLSMFDEKLSELAGETDLVILPEMFTTGFSMNAALLAETMEGDTFQWMRDKAKELGAVVTGSFIVKENGHYYNRLVWMRPDGTHERYDKRHLFTLAKEDIVYQAGTEKLIVEWKGWRICPLICYDLRFPVWSRNVEGYDLLIYVANWPETRRHHWQSLLVGRAIENQSYAVGVNRIGTDENGLVYSGDTCLIDYSGQTLYHALGAEDVFTCTLDKKNLAAFRHKLNFLSDQDKFKILPS